MKARRESRERRVELKKEIKHDCPDGLVYSNKKGKCINPHLEDEKLNEYSEDPEDRDKVPTNSLRFRHTLGKVQGVPQENKKTLPKGWN